MAAKRHLSYELEDGSRRMFDPSDEDLIYIYLRKKIHKPLFLLNTIIQLDVFQTEPWRLPRGIMTSISDSKYYFFKIKNSRFENKDTRPAGNGEWKSMEKNKEISLPNNMFTGIKNTLEFWKMQGGELVKTEWLMNEFRITSSAHPTEVSAFAAYRITKTVLPSVVDITMEDGCISPPPSP
ncbi:transcription factor JUNGBRUNNEN 1-like [Vicia villosa]|uniref:transcription factor JUNGBRUNNEN 1-like n=1 Tax=Vicia villosa TaxID=3911 RepID=UPI00273B055B|nr:transcription factor JUNGBRUNNEN 1-like [Vicia villosa]XP_058769171.1 transcription factor JUNGBRUNNEN 1-like [Vicia villosa]XP_058769172.1 transcription factor JUNGBRUNNEN 1-like [Vicia villosa]XP_058769173.1 transcription factor JUNGBRUNNEN 1-like [Vicia villosa]XP_058769174.1 transcription factor JUNGBRUNNEN 1-like [Vicia villosa]XP_058769175.1 transcription factor JUNGBRUNNEN 1-like [Vicia villosa]XP_058769176.1 transcription factor JUNGBRUNNEN 1-like [Vicia villosa]XP_058769177.1 tra